MIDFEFDRGKSQSNLKKHGIDFENAKAIWDDPDLIEVPARLQDKPRFLVIGQIKEKYPELNIQIIQTRINKSSFTVKVFHPFQIIGFLR